MHSNKLPDCLLGMDISAVETCISRLAKDRDAELMYIKLRYKKKIAFYKKAMILMRNMKRKS